MYTQLRCQTVWVNLIEPAPALPDGFMLLSKTNQSTCPAAHLMEMLIFYQSKSAGDTLPKNCVGFPPPPPLCKEIDSEAQNWLRGAGRGGAGLGRDYETRGRVGKTRQPAAAGEAFKRTRVSPEDILTFNRKEITN